MDSSPLRRLRGSRELLNAAYCLSHQWRLPVVLGVCRGAFKFARSGLFFLAIGVGGEGVDIRGVLVTWLTPLNDIEG